MRRFCQWCLVLSIESLCSVVENHLIYTERIAVRHGYNDIAYSDLFQIKLLYAHYILVILVLCVWKVRK